jgi:thiamine kinase-like enzyme
MTKVTPALLQQCGALHGFMHSNPLPHNCPYRCYTTPQEWCNELKQRLEELTTAGSLKPDEARRAFDCAVHAAPSAYDVGFVHRDFCAENIVLGPTGQMWVIDNETVGVDAYDYDLGRTWYRWPMNRRQWQAYLEGYRVHRSPDAFLSHFPFWSIVAIVGSAVFRLRRQRDGAREPIKRLRVVLSRLAQPSLAEERAVRSSRTSPLP